jgi:hypothetical protein
MAATTARRSAGYLIIFLPIWEPVFLDRFIPPPPQPASPVVQSPVSRGTQTTEDPQRTRVINQSTSQTSHASFFQNRKNAVSEVFMNRMKTCYQTRFSKLSCYHDAIIMILY